MEAIRSLRPRAKELKRLNTSLRICVLNLHFGFGRFPGYCQWAKETIWQEWLSAYPMSIHSCFFTIEPNIIIRDSKAPN